MAIRDETLSFQSFKGLGPCHPLHEHLNTPLNSIPAFAAFFSGASCFCRWTFKIRQRGNQGFLSVGRVKSNEIMWGDWQLFSLESKAFEPTVAARLVGLASMTLNAGKWQGWLERPVAHCIQRCRRERCRQVGSIRQ